MTSNNKILIIASAGGHLTQAICASSLCDNVVLVSNKYNVSHNKIKRFYKIIDTQHNVFIHFLNIFFALFVLIKERPATVFSTGGPIALPFALICKLVPIKFVYLDTLSRVVELSNTAKLLHKYKLYDEFYCQWKNVATKYNARYIGKCFDILGEKNYTPSVKSVTDKPIILVTVGTCQYDFERLFSYIYQMPLYQDDRVEWVIQVAHNDLEIKPSNGRVVNMVSRDEMENLVKSASLVISHCGIGSINLMLSYQKNVIFVPRVRNYNEFSDDHQLQIANEISGKLFEVVFPGEVFPNVSYDDLIRLPILDKPVDITNYDMANKLRDALFTK